MNTYLLIIILLLVSGGISFYFIYRYYSHQLQRELKRAQKSEQLKSAFLANASRSLRTPMNSILGYCNQLLAENDYSMTPFQTKEKVSHIQAETQQLLNFIAQLLELSNYEGSMPSFTLIEVNLAELMASYRREALNFTHPDVSVCLRTDLSPHCKATLDTNFMHQLMMHLLTEASKHTISGDISIHFTDDRRGLKVIINYGAVSQNDMPKEDVYTFLQNDNALMSHDNSQLGLSICRAIIDAVGGELNLDTGNGTKTTISFWIPSKLRDKHKKG